MGLAIRLRLKKYLLVEVFVSLWGLLSILEPGNNLVHHFRG